MAAQQDTRANQLEDNMNLKEKEDELLHEAKEEFDYVANPDNCGKVVSSHFNGIVITGYIFIILFLIAMLGVTYYYSHHIRHGQNHGSTMSQPNTQPQ